MNLSAVLITKNEAHIIGQTLAQLDWCNEIIVVDSGSTDGTVEICQSLGCKVVHHDFADFSSQKQFAINLAANNWILSLDADEVLSPELRQELIALCAAGNVTGMAGFQLPFRVMYMGRIMRWCGLARESHLRLFDRAQGAYGNSAVHESFTVAGPCGSLRYPVIHHTCQNIADHLAKMNQYTDYAASDYQQRKIRGSKLRTIVQFPFKFLAMFIFKGGVFDGYPGFMWSLMHAMYCTVKYAKVYEHSASAKPSC